MPEFLTYDQLPPEVQAAFGPPDKILPQPAPTAKPPPPPGTTIDPVDVSDIPGLVKLAEDNPDTFSPEIHAMANQERYESDPAYRAKLNDFNKAMVVRGFEWSDIDVVKGAKALGHMAVGLGKWGLTMASSMGKAGGTTAVTPVGKKIQSVVGPISGLGVPVHLVEKLFGAKETPEEVNKRFTEAATESAEALSSFEAGATGTVEMAKTGAKKLWRMLPGTRTPSEWTQEESEADLLAKIARSKEQEAIMAGKGEGTQALIGGAVQELGIDVDPEKVAQLSDPVTFFAIPGGFALGGKIAGKMVQLTTLPLRRSQAVQAVQSLNAARTAAVKTAQAARTAATEASAVSPALVEGATAAQPTLGAPIIEKAVRTAVEADKAAAAVSAAEKTVAELPSGQKAVLAATQAFNKSREGLAAAGQTVRAGVDRGLEVATGGAIAGAGLSLHGLGMLSRIPRIIRIPVPRGVGRGLVAAGKSLATEGTETWSPWAALAGSTVKGGVDVGVGAAKGLLFGDIPFAAMTSESPGETANFPLFGTAMGAGAGGRFGVQRVIVDQFKTQPMTDASMKITAAPGSVASLNRATEAAAAQAKPEQVRRFAAMRIAAAAMGTELYWASGDAGPSGKSPYRAALEQLMPGNTKEWYDQQEAAPGVTIERSAPDPKDPTKRVKQPPVILVKDPGTSRHEFTHAVQVLLGDNAMAKVREEVAAQYGDQWDSRGIEYMKRFKDLSKYYFNGESWREAMMDMIVPKWRETYKTPADMKKMVDQTDLYLNDELSAEVMDFVIKNQGPDLARDTGLPGMIARTLAKTMQAFGTEPFPAGTETAGQAVPLTYRAVEGISGAMREAKAGFKADVIAKEIEKGGLAPEVKPVAAAEAAGESPEAKAIRWVNEKAQPTDKTRAEAVQQIVAALQAGQPVRLSYFGAKGEPGGSAESMRPDRRAEIEAGREASQADKVLVTKDFWPTGVNVTNKGPQFQGWSVDNFTSNVNKFGGWLKDASNRGIPLPAEVAGLLAEYGIDPVKGITPENWNAILADAQTFSRNQRAGFTGSGKPVVLPKGGIAGYEQPALTGTAATPLNQTRADFINYMLGLPLAGEPGKAPVIRDATKVPLDVAGMEIAAKTGEAAGLPGRVQPPVFPRKAYGEGGKGTREKAAQLGIEGVSPQEVNPFRRAVEQTSKSEGIAAPSLIEVSQRLNFKDIGGYEGKPEGAPDVRANVLTTKAGFQAPKLEADIARVRESKDLNKDFGADVGGPTGFAYRMAALVQGGRDIKALQDARNFHAAETQKARAEKDFTRAVSEATKAQVMREAIEAAQDIGSGRGALPEGTAPLAPNKAHTEAGRALESKGWKFSETHNDLSRDGYSIHTVTVTDPATGKDGAIAYRTLPDGSAYVDFVRSPVQGQGFGSALYREMLSRLQAQGIEVLKGAVVAPEPIAIRRKLLGEPEIREPGLSGFSKKPEVASTVGDKNWAHVRNLIPGNVLFQAPPKGFKGEYVKDASIEFDDGKVFFGPSHYDAIVAGQKFYDDLGIKFNDQPQPVAEGWRTSARDLVSREEAYKVALKSGQTSEKKVLEWMKGEGLDTVFGTGEQLESAMFEQTRKFQAPEESLPLTHPEKGPITFDPETIKGGKISKPASSYKEAVTTGNNPYVRRSANAPDSVTPDNSNRQLMVQFASDLIYGAGKDIATGQDPMAGNYYDKLYSGARKGYARLNDFWEIPQWMGFGAHLFPNADVYVVRDMAQAKQFLKEAGYDRVLMSALDVNKSLVNDLLAGYEGKVDIGGYVDPKEVVKSPNITWHKNFESLAKAAGVEYRNGVDYRHFAGSDVIPRLTMSTGCKHKCAFCSVEKDLIPTPDAVVEQQANAIAELGSKLVYLNDKTFGQASNYRNLEQVNEIIKSKVPDFGGFIVQTTAAQMQKMPIDWLVKSGIRFVELGIETYNDPILKEMRKPATESLMDKAADKLREAGIAMIPNIIIGFPQETPQTYARTLEWLKKNADNISHANIYNLAVYKEAELGKKLKLGDTEADFNENVLEKSWMTDPQVHRTFAGELYGLASSMLEGKPESTKFQAPEELPANVGKISDMTELWEKTPRVEKTGVAAAAAADLADRTVQEAARTSAALSARGAFQAPGAKDRLQTEPSDATERKRPVAFQAPKDLPNVLYHGTDEKFTQFDLSRPIKTGPDENVARRGASVGESRNAAYFTDDLEYAKVFGNRVIAADILVDNTFDFRKPAHQKILQRLTGEDSQPVKDGWWDVMERPEVRDYLLENGFDSYFATDTTSGPDGTPVPFEKPVLAVLKSEKIGPVTEVKFAAPKDPEQKKHAIKEAAVRLSTGEIFTGAIHADAHEKAWESGKLKEGVSDVRTEDGFVTYDGEFLDVEAALDRARTLKQLSAKDEQEIARKFDVEDRLESRTFETYKKFAAPKKTDKKDFKVKPATISKAWIMPNGQPVQLGGKWHHEWLQENAKEATERWWIPAKAIKSGDQQEMRVEALKKGFARVNLEANSGNITFELRADDLRKHKAAIADFVESNASAIDNISVTLFNPNVSKVADSDSAAVFRLDDKDKVNNIPFVTKFQAPKEEGALPGFEEAPKAKTREELREESFRPTVPTTEWGNMTREEKKAHFAEAVVPKSSSDKLALDIKEAPLYKEAKTEEEAVDRYADRLVEFAKEYKDEPEFKAGAKWYEELVPVLKKTYGKDARIMAELLAATSPQTNPQANFSYAHDALLSLRAGRFDRQIKKFNEGLEKVATGTWESYYKREVSAGKIPNPPETPTPATFMGYWIAKHDLKPRSPHGTLYGISSDAVLKVAARTWLKENQGPKTDNFVKNMIGESDEATIDVWAARTMRWAGHEGKQERWRVMPENDGGLSNADFAFSQKAFRRAAERLKMKPSALQGALWFAEKLRWAKNGWSKLDLGSYTHEIKTRLPMVESRWRQRAEQEAQRTGARKAPKATEQLEILPK